MSDRAPASHPYFVLVNGRGLGFHFLDSAKRHAALNGGTVFYARDGARLDAQGYLTMPAGWSI
jgi:hypothetical protein